MKYIFINDETGNFKTHSLKKNKALAKLNRDAVIIKIYDNTTYLADCSSLVAEQIL